MKWLVLIALLLAVGCRGRGSPKTPEAHVAPQDLAGAPILVEIVVTGTYETQQDSNAARDLVLGELRSSGYSVELHDPRRRAAPKRVRRTVDLDREDDADEENANEEAESAKHEAHIIVRITLKKREAGGVKWMRGGKVMGGFVADVAIGVEFDAKVIATVSANFRFTRGEISKEKDELIELVRQLNATDGMKGLGAMIAARKRTRAQQLAAKQQQAEERRYAKWRRDVVDPCVEPKKFTSCDALKAWLAENKGDDDVADMWLEGNKVWDKSEPTVAKLRDDASWFDANEAECLEHATDDACDGVKRYLVEFPSGEHESDAKAALANLKEQSLARAAEKDASERREKAAQAAQSARAAESAKANREKQAKARAKQQCLANCSNKCGAILEQSAFQSCMASCRPKCK